MIIQMRLSERDLAKPQVQDLLDQAGWEPSDNDAEPGWFQVGVAQPYAAGQESEVGRQMLEPFLNLGVQPLAVKQLVIPLKTRISRVAMAISREDPDPVEANRLYALVDELPSDL